MAKRHRLATMLAAAALALAAPAAALAQNAGDNQYSDPFGSGGDSQSQGGSGSQGQGGSGSQGGSSDGSSQSQPAPSNSQPAATTQAQAPQPAAAGNSAQLPRTGAPAWLVAAAGALALGAGLALRRLAR